MVCETFSTFCGSPFPSFEYGGCRKGLNPECNVKMKAGKRAAAGKMSTCRSKLSEFCRHGWEAKGITLSCRGYGISVISFCHIFEVHPGGNLLGGMA